MTNPRDFLGREIKEGDTLVYPVRRGSSMWLKRITVTRVAERDGGTQVLGTNDDGRRITLMKPNRSVVVPLKCAYCDHDPYNTEG
jgi:hypothetical protein